MVAEPLSLLSDRPHAIPLRVGFGDRFRYLTGASGRRYLFTEIAPEDIGDFRSAVLVAVRRGGGGLRLVLATTLDAEGNLPGESAAPLSCVPPDARVLVHLLATSESERRSIAADISTPRAS